MQVEDNFIKLDTGSTFQLAYPDSDWLDDNRYILCTKKPSKNSYFNFHNILMI